jgi:hypothetical protein
METKKVNLIEVESITVVLGVGMEKGKKRKGRCW